MRRLFAVLMLVPLLGSDSPKEYDSATAVDGVEGTWRVVAAEIDGSRVPMKVTTELTLRAGRWRISDLKTANTGNYTVEPGSKPAHLDIVTSGETNKYIYRIDGDTLRLARYEQGVPHPKSFNDTGIVIIICKRVGK
jgi:uncharacterized protein (TIGR03067 family)